MDLFDVVRMCARRWYVFLPLFLLSAGYAYHLYTAVKPVSYANAVISIAPPNKRDSYSAEPMDINGLLESGGPTFITNLAVIAGSDPAFKQKVVAAGGSPSFTVKNFPSPAGVQTPLPLIMIETTQSDSSSALKTIEIAANNMDTVFHDVQQSAGVTDPQMVRAIVVSPARSIQAMPSRTKSSAGIFFGGLGISILASVIVDAFATRVLRKKASPLNTGDARATSH